jgi:hypothetical protein
VKSWTPTRINSLLFDQPGAHHNPQRDPYPSQQWVAEDATVGPFQLSRTLLSTLKGTWRPVKWSRGARPMPLTWVGCAPVPLALCDLYIPVFDEEGCLLSSSGMSPLVMLLAATRTQAAAAMGGVEGHGCVPGCERAAGPGHLRRIHRARLPLRRRRRVLLPPREDGRR